MPPVATLALDARVKIVVTNAAGKLPAAVGRELLKLIEPQALAIMVGVLTVWAVAHFVGVGVAADLVLLVVGVAWRHRPRGGPRDRGFRFQDDAASHGS